MPSKTPQPTPTTTSFLGNKPIMDVKSDMDDVVVVKSSLTRSQKLDTKSSRKHIDFILHTQ
jgi:hypothetical protein